MWLYLICIPYAIVYYVIAAYYSKKLNDDPKSWTLITFLVIFQLFSIWPVFARYSKNIIFDGQLIDLIILLSYSATMVWMGCGKDFTCGQWIGMAMVLIGLLMLKFTG
jgi:multidrug transporter EmrE-like cation transporter